MNELFWKLIAKVLSQPAIVLRLIQYAMRHPYNHILSPDGTEVYMYRYWLFNPYKESGAKKRKGWGWLPSIRIHRIMRPDVGVYKHDHPWNARTLILRGWYWERRTIYHFRMAGDTAALKFGEFHRITDVSPSGAWTLFISWKLMGPWGFEVDGKKVPWREHLGVPA